MKVINTIFILFLFSYACGADAQRTRTLSDWKALYDERYSFRGNFEERGWLDAYNVSRDNGDIYPMAYILYGELLMWQSTGEDIYIQRFISFYQGLFNRARPASIIGLGGNGADNFQYFNDEYLSWVDYPQTTDLRDSDRTPQNFTGANLGVSHFQASNPNGYQQFSLDEGFGLRIVAEAVRIMYQSPLWRSQGTNQSNYEELLNFMVAHVWDKWQARAGDHLFRERTHMASHWASIGMDLYVITGQEKYFTVFDRWFTNMGAWNNEPEDPDFPDYGFANGQIRIHTDGGYVWSGVWGDQTGVNDVGHANAEVATAIKSVQLGFDYFSQADLNGFKLAYDRTRKNDTRTWWLIDGSSGGRSDHFVVNAFDANGWHLLAPYYEDILEDIENASYIGSVYRNRLHASGAFASAIIDGHGLFYPEQQSEEENADAEQMYMIPTKNGKSVIFGL